jgi:hypothetical protein
VRTTGIAPIAICIQKPSQPRREKARARLSCADGLKAFRNTCSICRLSVPDGYNTIISRGR